MRGRTLRPRGRKAPFAWLPALAVLALLVTACATVSSPQGWAGPRQANDTLLVSIARGKMAALNADDLSLRWVFPPETPAGRRLNLEAIYAAPAVADGVAYFGAYDGNIYALDLATGNPLWTFKTGGPIIGGVALAGDALLVGSDDGNLYVLEAASGQLRARFSSGDSIWATPLVVGSIAYVPSVNGKLYALEVATLHPVWERPFKADAGLLMDPVLADDQTLLVGGIDRRLYALDPATGDVRWSFKADNWFWGRPLVADGRIYAPNLDGRVYALGLDGNALWSAPFEAGTPLRASPLLAAGVLIVVDRDGNVYGLDPATGAPKWAGPAILQKTVLADPILLQGQVLVVAQGGGLFRIEPSAGASSPLEVRRP